MSFAPPPSYAGESVGQGCEPRSPFMWMNLLGKKILSVVGRWRLSDWLREIERTNHSGANH